MKIKSLFVLGSTSLIARELCLELAKEGCKKFHLVCRNSAKNLPLIKQLENDFNASVSEEVVNLKDDNLYSESLPKEKDFDLYLITAGTLGNNELAISDINESYKIFNVNYYFLVPWIMSITNHERLNKNSRLWVFSSVASDRGRPSNYSYGAAKSALTTYCEGLIARSIKSNFKIRLIKAGFMMTPMSEGKAPKILCIKPKDVAKKLLKQKDKTGVEYLPWWWFPIMKIIKILPSKFVSKL